LLDYYFCCTLNQDPCVETRRKYHILWNSKVDPCLTKQSSDKVRSTTSMALCILHTRRSPQLQDVSVLQRIHFRCQMQRYLSRIGWYVYSVTEPPWLLAVMDRPITCFKHYVVRQPTQWLRLKAYRIATSIMSMPVSSKAVFLNLWSTDPCLTARSFSPLTGRCPK